MMPSAFINGLVCIILATASLDTLPALAAEGQGADSLTLDRATKVIEAAKAEATRLHQPAVIAVVDASGWLIALQRMDEPAMLASVELAPGKARAAAIFRKPTSELEKAINGGRFAAITARDFVEMQGGIPLRINGHVVGAIGVSADTPAHDEQIAEAGTKALVP